MRLLVLDADLHDVALGRVVLAGPSTSDDANGALTTSSNAATENLNHRLIVMIVCEGTDRGY